ncbi:MAG TPA: xanthine dehydrogenase family protein molybdopterin-binding subunit [Novosphingobium sp.]|nr:xanthine dehydrogenase family protein molybdopterin-binding subunit [Novosphingobium sp.]
MNAPERPDAFKTGDLKVVGTRPVRPDGNDKVTGKAVFGPDFKAANMLQGALLRSPHAHARIRSIDIRKAEALPGVKAVVTREDFPTLEDILMNVGETAGSVLDLSQNVIAREKVFYDGHVVAGVAATSEAVAREALALIEVDYEVLPHVIGIEDAFRPDAPVLHDTVFTRGLDEKPEQPSNVPLRMRQAKGDVEIALGDAAATVSGHYSMLPVHQGYIEPHACVASWKADGKVDIWCSSQGAFNVRGLTSAILGIPTGTIRVMPLEIGGGFGGKTTVYLEPLAVVLSRKAGRPVRLTMSRTDIFRASGPAPGAVLDVRLGATAEGTLTAAEVEFKYSSGAFSGYEVFLGISSAIGHYNIQNYVVTGWGVLSNMPKHAAYRAPGAPQVNFAVESAMNELAEKLGMDPLELRLKNAIRPGETSMSGTPHGEIALVECLEAARDHPHYSEPLGPNQGRGVACGYWGNHGGPSTASVAVAEDGSILVVEGNPDIGGSRASMALMAAETFGVDYGQVSVTIADTSSIGFSGVTGGSRTTFATGKAVVEASRAVVEILCDRAAKLWNVDRAQVEWRDGEAICGAGEKAGETLSLARIAAKADNTGGPISAEASVNPLDHLPGYAVHICDAEVDRETGHTRILRYTTVQDVGRAIHPDYVEGQMQGGAVQGIGWALNEAFVYDANGRLDNPGFLDYRMPVASDLPMIETVMIERPNPAHPYGVKGVGEVPIVPPLAAVAAAVSEATGVRMRDLPITPDRVHAVLHPDG